MADPRGQSCSGAIVNLGSLGLKAETLVPELVALGVHVIGHAGHKEKELLELGRRAGCQTVATNSEITFKIPFVGKIVEAYLVKELKRNYDVEPEIQRRFYSEMD